MSSAINSKTTQLSLLRQMAAGVLKRLSGQTLALSGGTIKAEALAAKITAIADQLTASDAARTTWKQQLLVTKKSQSAFAPTLKDLRRYLQGMFGVDSEALLDFGMTLLHPPVTTPQTAAAAVEKRNATREARHTMGTKQKATIHGVVTPAAPAAAPAAPAAPAPAAVPNATGGKTG